PMPRDIWKKYPAELQKRLSSPGCREYKRRRDEIEDTAFEWGKDGTLINTEYNLCMANCYSGGSG
ncbi:MAG: hypothetical protein WBO34_00310, partial [Gammaproteobacteria bacterium]